MLIQKTIHRVFSLTAITMEQVIFYSKSVKKLNLTLESKWVSILLISRLNFFQALLSLVWIYSWHKCVNILTKRSQFTEQANIPLLNNCIIIFQGNAQRQQRDLGTSILLYKMVVSALRHVMQEKSIIFMANPRNAGMDLEGQWLLMCTRFSTRSYNVLYQFLMLTSTPYFFTFNSNAGKYRPEKLQIRTLFVQW